LKRDGYVIEANKAFLDFFRVERERLIHKNSHDTMPLKVFYESITRCIYEKIEISEQLTFGDHVLNATITPVLVNDSLNFISIVLRDVSAFVQLEKALLKRNKELGIINTLSLAFISSGDIDSIFSDLLEKVLIVSDFSIGWIVVREDNRFILKGISGVSLSLKHGIERGEIDSLYKSVTESEDPLYVLESREVENIDILRKEGIMFFACIPLRIGSETMGILVLASRIEVKFDFDLAALFSLIGNNVSIIIEKARLFQESQRLAITDPMTGLYNVRYFYDSLNKEIARAKRYNNSFSLILFDIDDFKVLNDTYGHQAGDEVLRSLASILKNISRQTDIVARYGGEEFIVILPNTSKDESFTLANRIREKVEEYNHFIEEDVVKITVSGGIATFPEDAGDSKSLLYAADMALYKAKALGKKRIYSYEPMINGDRS
jgi:diguanylate cyclase (GGDEF)-like protein